MATLTRTILLSLCLSIVVPIGAGAQFEDKVENPAGYLESSSALYTSYNLQGQGITVMNLMVSEFESAATALEGATVGYELMVKAYDNPAEYFVNDPRSDPAMALLVDEYGTTHVESSSGDDRLLVVAVDKTTVYMMTVLGGRDARSELDALLKAFFSIPHSTRGDQFPADSLPEFMTVKRS